MGIWYTTREKVKARLDISATARIDALVDDAIDAASAPIEGCLHRRFYPELATRYFDWPNYQYARTFRLWLESSEAISLSQLVSGGVTILASDYFLRRSDGLDEPPYDSIEIDLASSAAFGSGSTHQRSIAATGLFGFDDTSAPAGALAEALDSSETAVDVTNAALVGVGNIVKCESERMIVTDRAQLDTGQDLIGTIAADKAVVSLTVADGTALHVGETLLLDSERMQVIDIAGNVLTVKRAVDGSVLAAHTNSSIYAPRALTVTRGALGTTAAAHADTTALTRYVVPAAVDAWARALAIDTLLQESSGYARMVGSGDNEREASGRALKIAAQRAEAQYGRVRLAAI